MPGIFEIGPIRPPSEAESLLVRVTRNCPWNRCRFCRSYRGEVFSRRSAGEVMADIAAMKRIREELSAVSGRRGGPGAFPAGISEVIPSLSENAQARECVHHVAQWLQAGGKSAFLQDANTLILPAPELIEILTCLTGTFPGIRRITSYGRSHTLAIEKKSRELPSLRAAGLNRIHIGMESGSDTVLGRIQKGVTAAEHVRAGKNVAAAGIELSLYYIPGLGGAALSHEHAIMSARVINEIQPHFIRLRSFTPVPGTGLARDIRNGAFSPLTEEEVVKELRLFITTLELHGSRVVSDHPVNLLAELEGTLPGEKARLLGVIDSYLALDPREKDLFHTGRRMGYFRHLADLHDPYLRSQAQGALLRLTARGRDLGKRLRSLARRFI